MGNKEVIIEEITSQLTGYVFSDDVTVTWVLRAHLAVESSIDEMLHELVPRGKKLTSGGRFSFNHKLEFCHAMDLINDRMYAILKALNNLRNNCAHNLLDTIHFSDLSKLNDALGKDVISAGMETSNTALENEMNSIQLQKFLIYILSNCVAQMSTWVALSREHQNYI
ncbi:hypothetical protein AYY19_04305 [Photobacterium aquimaris]|uniref:hypothetical protein n=1 Tax=Photobacterium aquimaris TaxID=512643 RepID=UPI0007F01A09|nr:hypothetical protein [Photobacterium aquimaris]OBU16386.1 hypothetical protein AYY19_04305 [Photobacterium aquimaris]PSW02209.1 hypothetical protein CTM91_03775 [Photobacterium aquimaris]